jgi:hypothetical protein
MDRTPRESVRAFFRREKRDVELDADVSAHFEILTQRYMERGMPKEEAQRPGAFAGFALLLAITGLYGVVAQLVEQRTQEIGIRMALGAQASDVLGLIMRQGMLLAGIGAGAGLLTALLLRVFSKACSTASARKIQPFWAARPPPLRRIYRRDAPRE